MMTGSVSQAWRTSGMKTGCVRDLSMTAADSGAWVLARQEGRRLVEDRPVVGAGLT